MPVEAIRIVVANTAPVVAGWLGGFLEDFPRVFREVHVPTRELDEWYLSVDNIRRKRPAAPPLDIRELASRWTQSAFLQTHVLTARQAEVALQFSGRIHPERPDEKRIDGEAVALARTLTEIGAVDALLADEDGMRAVARAEGIPVIGSLWVVGELHRRGFLTTAEALAVPARLMAHGQFVSTRVIETFSRQIRGPDGR